MTDRPLRWVAVFTKAQADARAHLTAADQSAAWHRAREMLASMGPGWKLEDVIPDDD